MAISNSDSSKSAEVHPITSQSGDKSVDERKNNDIESTQLHGIHLSRMTHESQDQAQGSSSKAQNDITTSVRTPFGSKDSNTTPKNSMKPTPKQIASQYFLKSKEPQKLQEKDTISNVSDVFELLGEEVKASGQKRKQLETNATKKPSGIQSADQNHMILPHPTLLAQFTDVETGISDGNSFYRFISEAFLGKALKLPMEKREEIFEDLYIPKNVICQLDNSKIAIPEMHQWTKDFAKDFTEGNEQAIREKVQQDPDLDAFCIYLIRQAAARLIVKHIDTIGILANQPTKRFGDLIEGSFGRMSAEDFVSRHILPMNRKADRIAQVATCLAFGIRLDVVCLSSDQKGNNIISGYAYDGQPSENTKTDEHENTTKMRCSLTTVNLPVSHLTLYQDTRAIDYAVKTDCPFHRVVHRGGAEAQRKAWTNRMQNSIATNNAVVNASMLNQSYTEYAQSQITHIYDSAALPDSESGLCDTGEIISYKLSELCVPDLNEQYKEIFPSSGRLLGRQQDLKREAVGRETEEVHNSCNGRESAVEVADETKSGNNNLPSVSLSTAGATGGTGSPKTENKIPFVAPQTASGLFSSEHGAASLSDKHFIPSVGAQTASGLFSSNVDQHRTSQNNNMIQSVGAQTASGLFSSNVSQDRTSQDLNMLPSVGAQTASGLFSSADDRIDSGVASNSALAQEKPATVSDPTHSTHDVTPREINSTQPTQNDTAADEISGNLSNTSSHTGTIENQYLHGLRDVSGDLLPDWTGSYSTSSFDSLNRNSSRNYRSYRSSSTRRTHSQTSATSGYRLFSIDEYPADLHNFHFQNSLQRTPFANEQTSFLSSPHRSNRGGNQFYTSHQNSYNTFSAEMDNDQLLNQHGSGVTSFTNPYIAAQDMMSHEQNYDSLEAQNVNTNYSTTPVLTAKIFSTLKFMLCLLVIGGVLHFQHKIVPVVDDCCFHRDLNGIRFLFVDDKSETVTHCSNDPVRFMEERRGWKEVNQNIHGGWSIFPQFDHELQKEEDAEDVRIEIVKMEKVVEEAEEETEPDNTEKTENEEEVAQDESKPEDDALDSTTDESSTESDEIDDDYFGVHRRIAAITTMALSCFGGLAISYLAWQGSAINHHEEGEVSTDLLGDDGWKVMDPSSVPKWMTKPSDKIDRALKKIEVDTSVAAFSEWVRGIFSNKKAVSRSLQRFPWKFSVLNVERATRVENSELMERAIILQLETSRGRIVNDFKASIQAMKKQLKIDLEKELTITIDEAKIEPDWAQEKTNHAQNLKVREDETGVIFQKRMFLFREIKPEPEPEPEIEEQPEILPEPTESTNTKSTATPKKPKKKKKKKVVAEIVPAAIPEEKIEIEKPKTPPPKPVVRKERTTRPPPPPKKKPKVQPQTEPKRSETHYTVTPSNLSPALNDSVSAYDIDDSEWAFDDSEAEDETGICVIFGPGLTC